MLIYNVFKKCFENAGTSYNCYLYAYEIMEREPICQRFNRDPSKVYSNCALNTSNISAYRSGWLENFNPLRGHLHSK